MTNKIFSAPGLKLDFEERSHEATVRCCGKITAGSSDMFQREIAGKLIPESRGKLAVVNTRIVLDFSRVCYVDSAGLKAILGLWTAGQNRCCDVEIVDFSTQTRRLLSMSRLDQVLTYMKSLLQRGKRPSTETSERHAAEDRALT